MSDNSVPQDKSLYQEMQERERQRKQMEEQMQQQANPVPQFDVNHQLTNPMLNQ